MKYLIFKIIGILGLVATPIIMNSLYPLVKESGSIVARETWFEGCEILLIVFLIITMAGFSRFIAKMKAYIDFYTDFDDDQHLECYPKLKIYSFIKKIVAIISIVAIIVISILKEKVAFITNNYNYIILAIVSLVLVLFLINIIICFAIKVVPLHFDISIVLTIVGFALESMLIYFGCSQVVSMLITAPIFAFATLYFACACDDYISIDELFDWLCYDYYKNYYSMLCEKENSQNSKEKIEKKVNVRNTRKTTRKNKKENKSNKKQSNKNN